jgi:ferredoxin
VSQQRVEINTSTCQGIGICEQTVPGVFEVGKDGVSHVDQDAVADAQDAELQEAVANCPTQSVRVS